MASIVQANTLYYAGSRKFQWMTEYSGLDIDQLNFVLGQVFALVAAIILRLYIRPSKDMNSTIIRHVYCMMIGFSMLYFCFGHHLFHVVVESTTCYIIMKMAPPQHMPRVVLVFAMMYLSAVHLMRQVYSYGSYTLDITGPMMIVTQKVTSFAFSLHDGLAKDRESLTPDQTKLVIKELPSLLEYYSYIFHFQSLMCGPTIFYKDYVSFIEGRHYPIADKGKDTEVKEPSPTAAVASKIAASVFFALVLLHILPLFPIRRVIDDDFVLNTSLFYKTLYLLVATAVVRSKYYHAWLLADAICNASGLGFNGWDVEGRPKWNFVSNVDVVKFEMGLSLRDSMLHWNRSTMLWLRRIVYERTTKARTFLTYGLSAIWHGFYPGYYITFVTGSLFTLASRNVRRCVRPYFQTSPSMARIYDVLTFFTTKIFMAYLTFPFILLEFWPSMRLYWHMYMWLHVVAVLGVFVLPVIVPQRKGTAENRGRVKEEQ